MLVEKHSPVFLCLLKVLICECFILCLILVMFADVREEGITLKSVMGGRNCVILALRGGGQNARDYL